MSKKYVFLTYAITSIGGGQIYCKNKYKYCESQGFDAYVFSSYNGKIFVKDLEKFSPLVINELEFSPATFGSKTIENILNLICEKIDYKAEDKIIIESHTPYLAVWGELLAKKINAKHIAYLLGEHFDGLPNYVFDYLYFKYNRKELACIKNDAMQKMFAPYKTLALEECYNLNATLGNPVEDICIPNEYIEKCEGKKVVGVIGRGDKSYVYQSVKDTCEFVKEKPQDKFVLLVIGSVVEGFCEKIQEVVSACENVELIMTGEQFPIPKKMLKLMDIAFAAAGCVRPPYFEYIPTISMDVYDNMPIGAMGYDTTAGISRETQEFKPSSYYLEEILYGNFVNENEFIEPVPIDLNAAYEKHFEFIKNSCYEKEYYDFSNMNATKKDKIFSIIYKLGGVKLIRFIKKLKSRF